METYIGDIARLLWHCDPNAHEKHEERISVSRFSPLFLNRLKHCSLFAPDMDVSPKKELMYLQSNRLRDDEN